MTFFIKLYIRLFLTGIITAKIRAADKILNILSVAPNSLIYWLI
jgi:hypothetical protein